MSADMVKFQQLKYQLLIYFYSQGEGVRLLPREKSEVQNLLPDTITEEEKERIYAILGQAVCRPAGIQARKHDTVLGGNSVKVTVLIHLYS